MYMQMLQFRVLPSVYLFQVNVSKVFIVVRVVATFGSAYYGIVNSLREKLEEYIQMKVAELAAENLYVCWTP